MIFTQSADVVKIEDRPFAPSLLEKDNVFYLSFNYGYVNLVYDLDENYVPKIVEPKNINEKFTISQEKEFYLQLSINPESNQVDEAEIVDDETVLEEAEQQIVLSQKIYIPIVKIKKNSQNKFYIKHWLLRENIQWTKKLVSTPCKVEYIGGGKVIVSYGEFTDSNVGIGNFNAPGYSTILSVEKNDVIGLLVTANIDLQNSENNYIISAEIQSFQRGVDKDENFVTKITSLAGEDNSIDPPSGACTTFFPIAYISKDSFSVTQAAYGNFSYSRIAVSSVVVSSTEESTITINTYNISIQGVI